MTTELMRMLTEGRNKGPFSDLFFGDFLDEGASKSYDHVSRQHKFPPNQVSESEYALCMKFALAGWKREHITVKIENDELIIIGKFTGEKVEEDFREVFSNMAMRDFVVTYSIVSSKFDIDDICVKFKKGILRIELPIAESAKPVEFEIN